MSKIICVFMFSFILASCASVSQKDAQIVLSQCPFLKKYTKEQLIKAASELKMIPNDAQISEMLSDYSKLRDACRVAEEKLKKTVK